MIPGNPCGPGTRPCNQLLPSLSRHGRWPRKGPLAAGAQGLELSWLLWEGDVLYMLHRKLWKNESPRIQAPNGKLNANRERYANGNKYNAK